MFQMGGVICTARSTAAAVRFGPMNFGHAASSAASNTLANVLVCGGPFVLLLLPLQLALQGCPTQKLRHLGRQRLLLLLLL